MWTHDLAQALRIFRREPAFAAAAVLTLTLGIGANTALFAVVDAVLLRPLPFAGADRLVVLRHRDLPTGLTKPDIAVGDFVDLRARQRSLESLGGFGGYTSTLFGGSEPVRVEGVALTPDALTALRISPALGRLLTADDAREGAPPVAMVSHEFWQTRLGSDPKVLARSLQLGSTHTAVVGVLPPGFRFPIARSSDIVIAQPVPTAAPAQRRSGWIYGIGRLRDGSTVADAGAELTALSQQFEREFGDQNRGTRYEALALRDALIGDARRPLTLMLAAVGFVLLIACANVGNLLLARALGREQELAVRVALGASRRRLALQLLFEGLVLALAGAGVGTLVAWQVAPALAALVPTAASIPGLEHVSLNPAVLAFTIVAAIASAVLFSAVASVGLARADRGGLGTQRQATMTPGARRAASTLVVAEIALAVVLLAGAGLTLRSFSNLLAVDPGFTPAGVLTVQVDLPAGRYDEDAARRAFYTRAFEDIDALPQVDAVGAAMVTPLTGNNWTVPLQRVDRPLAAGERPPDIGWQMASAGYFRALNIPLRAGRLFQPADATGPAVVIVSQAVVDRFFAGETAIGRRIDLGDMTAEIVGVVGNIRRAALADDPRADLYFPFERVNIPSVTLFIRTTGDAVAALPAVNAAVRRLEPNAVLYDTRTMSAIAEESAAITRLATRLLSGFAVIGILLAAIGVYGVMSYQVRRRTRELGTRLALGASPSGITRLVLTQAAWVAGLGLVVGTSAALVLGRTLTSVLFGVEPWDPATLLVAAALLAAATLLASYLPARRAGRVDPATIFAAE